MGVKPWICPDCRQEFIVEAEAIRDTCPWCNAAVEEREGRLQVVVVEEPPIDDEEQTPPEQLEDARDSEPAPAPSGTQSWWPFGHNGSEAEKVQQS